MTGACVIMPSRRHLVTALTVAPLWPLSARATRHTRIDAAGARPDGRTVNTVAIQRTIDDLARSGGGTLVVPRGVFVTGALFLKPGVHLHLEADAVLRCSPDTADFPRQRTRIEGHFEPSFTPALINADGCDGLRITGSGTLDGAGRAVWDLFWTLRAAAPVPSEFPNIGIARARLALIENSRGVEIDGVTFRDSQFWNLHLYHCRGVAVRGCRFEVPDDYRQAPSTDGIDLDSCQDVTVDGCYFSVTDDCIAAKGSKGPRALLDTASPPVERIRVRNCHFRRGHQAFACGSEATVVRDVVIEDCRVTGAINVLRMKLRPDTPQLYENIHVRGIRLDDDRGRIVMVEPWSQYVALDGAAPPGSTVRNVSLRGIRGRFGSFGSIRPNPGRTRIEDIVIADVDVRLGVDPMLKVSGVDRLKLDNVRVNGAPMAAPAIVHAADATGAG